MRKIERQRDQLLPKMAGNETLWDAPRIASADDEGIQALAQEVLNSGGFTVSTDTLTPVTSGIVVGDHDSLDTKVIPNAVSQGVDAIAQAISDYRDAARSAGMQNFGGWVDSNTGGLELDVSTIVNDLGTAEDLARQRGEKAYFDLSTGTEYWVDYSKSAATDDEVAKDVPDATQNVDAQEPVVEPTTPDTTADPEGEGQVAESTTPDAVESPEATPEADKDSSDKTASADDPDDSVGFGQNHAFGDQEERDDAIYALENEVIKDPVGTIPTPGLALEDFYPTEYGQSDEQIQEDLRDLVEDLDRDGYVNMNWIDADPESGIATNRVDEIWFDNWDDAADQKVYDFIDAHKGADVVSAKTASVPDWAVDADGNPLQVGAQYRDQIGLFTVDEDGLIPDGFQTPDEWDDTMKDLLAQDPPVLVKSANNKENDRVSRVRKAEKDYDNVNEEDASYALDEQIEDLLSAQGYDISGLDGEMQSALAGDLYGSGFFEAYTDENGEIGFDTNWNSNADSLVQSYLNDSTTAGRISAKRRYLARRNKKSQRKVALNHAWNDEQPEYIGTGDGASGEFPYAFVTYPNSYSENYEWYVDYDDGNGNPVQFAQGEASTLEEAQSQADDALTQCENSKNALRASVAFRMAALRKKADADRSQATQYVVEAIEGPSGETDSSDFDIDSIVDQIYSENNGSWDFSTFDNDRFWDIVEANAYNDDDQDDYDYDAPVEAKRARRMKRALNEYQEDANGVPLDSEGNPLQVGFVYQDMYGKFTVVEDGIVEGDNDPNGGWSSWDDAKECWQSEDVPPVKVSSSTIARRRKARKVRNQRRR